MDERELEGGEPEEEIVEVEETEESEDGEAEEETEASLLKSLGLEYEDFDSLKKAHLELKAQKEALEAAPVKKATEEREQEPFLPRGQFLHTYQKRVAGKDQNDPAVKEMRRFAQDMDEQYTPVWDKIERVLGTMAGELAELRGVKQTVEWSGVDAKVRQVVPRETVSKVMAKHPTMSQDEAIKYIVATDKSVAEKLQGVNLSAKKPLPPSLQGRSKPAGNGTGQSYTDFMKDGDLDTSALYAKLGIEKGGIEYRKFLGRKKK